MNTQIRQGVEQHLQEVVGLLRKEIELFRRVIEVTREERTVIAAMDVSALIRLTRAKEEVLSVVHGLDDELQTVLARLGETGKLGASRLANLEPYFPAQASRRYRELRQDWARLREEVLAANVVNRRFIQETLAFLGDAIALFAGGERPRNDCYAAVGKPGRASVAPCVISREV